MLVYDNLLRYLLASFGELSMYYLLFRGTTLEYNGVLGGRWHASEMVAHAAPGCQLPGFVRNCYDAIWKWPPLTVSHNEDDGNALLGRQYTDLSVMFLSSCA